jgi:hypothetical protein
LSYIARVAPLTRDGISVDGFTAVDDVAVAPGTVPDGAEPVGDAVVDGELAPLAAVVSVAVPLHATASSTATSGARATRRGAFIRRTVVDDSLVIIGRF